jgi:hypothetical protein
LLSFWLYITITILILFFRLHHIQLDIAHHAAISESLKLGIQRHGPFPPPAGPSGLLGTPSEKYKAWQLKAQCEIIQHRVLLLREEKAKKNAAIANLKHEAKQIEEENKNFGILIFCFKCRTWNRRKKFNILTFKENLSDVQVGYKNTS